MGLQEGDAIARHPAGAMSPNIRNVGLIAPKSTSKMHQPESHPLTEGVGDTLSPGGCKSPFSHTLTRTLQGDVSLRLSAGERGGGGSPPTGPLLYSGSEVLKGEDGERPPVEREATFSNRERPPGRSRSWYSHEFSNARALPVLVGVWEKTRTLPRSLNDLPTEKQFRLEPELAIHLFYCQMRFHIISKRY